MPDSGLVDATSFRQAGIIVSPDDGKANAAGTSGLCFRGAEADTLRRGGTISTGHGTHSAEVSDIDDKRFDAEPIAPRHRARRAWTTLRLSLAAADLAVLVAVPEIIHRLYLGVWAAGTIELAFIELSCALSFCSLQLAGAYKRQALQRVELVWSCLALAAAGTIMGVLGFGFVTRAFSDLSRVWVIGSLCATGGVVLAMHLTMTVLVAFIMQLGHLRERVAIVCAGPLARMALERFRSVDLPEVSIVGVFDDRKERLPEGFESVEVKGDTSSLLTYVRRHGIDRVIVAIPWTAERRIVALVAKLRQVPVRVDLIPDRLIWEFPSDVHRIQGVPIVTVANRRVEAQMGLMKRLEDLVLGSALLVLAAPLMLAVAIAIRLDSRGPILFRQKRSGFNNEVVEVLKFRSMYADRAPDPDVRQATKSDARVTRVGRFIRRTSLDELPQLLNVVAGAMSLVGPRPHALPHNKHFGGLVDGYFARHNVKPGITGWAQINGARGETDTIEKMNRRIRYDLEYIERWSLLFDLKIIFLTAFRVWSQETAY